NVHPVSGLVGDDHQNQAQQLADQVHRRGQLELGAAAQADAVDIGGQHVAGGEDVVVVQVVELVEVGGEEAGDVQDQHDDDGRHDGRYGDLGQKLPAVGPIHPGRLVQRGVDRRHGGQIHDGPVACVLDQSRNDHDPPEQV